MNEPLVQVLIPAFNAEKTIVACLKSVLEQSYSNYQIRVCLDGCTDNTEATLKSLEIPDLEVLVNPTNMGIAATRNRLIAAIDAPYVAWLDADDFMLPDRLRQQVVFLEKNPTVHVLGTGALLRNFKPSNHRLFYPKHSFIRAFQVFKTAMFFSTLMTRNFYKEACCKFDEEFRDIAEDFEWFARVGSQKQFANLPICLTSVYVETEETRNKKDEAGDAKEAVLKVLRNNMNELKLEVSDGDLNALVSFVKDSDSIDSNHVAGVMNLLLSCRKANNKLKVYPVKEFNAVVLLHLLRLMKAGYKLNFIELLRIFSIRSVFLIFMNRKYYH